MKVLIDIIITSFEVSFVTVTFFFQLGKYPFLYRTARPLNAAHKVYVVSTARITVGQCLHFKKTTGIMTNCYFKIQKAFLI